MENLPDEEKMELVSICPGICWGPVYHLNHAASLDFFNMFCDGKMSVGMQLMWSYVDIRDVALAHLQGVKVKEAAGQRFLLTAHAHFPEKLAKVLTDNYPGKYKLKYEMEPPLGVFKFGAYCCCCIGFPNI